MALIKCGISFPLFAAILATVCFWGKATGSAVRSEVSETCEADHGAFQLKMTPGFLASSLPYVGHHDCTEEGVCRNISSLCPLTSCCRSQSGTSNGTAMHCGCLDRNGECVPLRSFRLGWETCGGDSGGHVTSNFEITHILDDDGMQCSGSNAVLQFGPAFLSGLGSELTSAGHDGCSASGHCSGRPNISPNTCSNGENCCVLTRDINGRRTGCECVEGIPTCLEHKEFQVTLKKCTENGDIISRVYTVVALNIDQQCKERSSLVDMYLDSSGKIQIVTNLQKCIPSSSGSTTLLVESVVSAEQSVENFLPTLKAVLRNMHGDDPIAWGEPRK